MSWIHVLYSSIFWSVYINVLTHFHPLFCYNIFLSLRIKMLEFFIHKGGKKTFTVFATCSRCDSANCVSCQINHNELMLHLKRLPWLFCPSDTFVKPNLWLLVNPNIACPIQYGENAADLQTLSEPAQEIQAPQAATQHQLSTELHMFAPHDAPLQEELRHSVSSSTEYTVQYTLKASPVIGLSHAGPHECMHEDTWCNMQSYQWCYTIQLIYRWWNHKKYSNASPTKAGKKRTVS